MPEKVAVFVGFYCHVNGPYTFSQAALQASSCTHSLPMAGKPATTALYVLLAVAWLPGSRLEQAWQPVQIVAQDPEDYRRCLMLIQVRTLYPCRAPFSPVRSAVTAPQCDWALSSAGSPSRAGALHPSRTLLAGGRRRRAVGHARLCGRRGGRRGRSTSRTSLFGTTISNRWATTVRYMHVYVYVFACACVCVCTCICTCVCACICTCVCKCALHLYT